MANSLQVATINGIGDFILFLGKLAVGLICGLVSVLMLRNREDIHFYIIPCILIALFSFFIAHIILSLFEVRIDFLRTHLKNSIFQGGFFPIFPGNAAICEYFFHRKMQFCFFFLFRLDGGRHTIFVCL